MSTLSFYLPAVIAFAFGVLFTLGYVHYRARGSRIHSEGVDKRLAELSLEMARQARASAEAIQLVEAKAETILRQQQSDMKLVELQMRAAPGRAVPESVDTAIRLVRAGESVEEVIRQTGLSQAIVESINAVHAGQRR